MLHTQTVEPNTLSLLKQLMEMPELNDFYLVGGTALSLKFGHRISVDIDLFSHTTPNFSSIHALLKAKFNHHYLSENLKINFAIFCQIFDIKTDLVHYPHPIISEIEIIDGIRMYSTKDIAAMKINAVLGRGVKKDFWDLYEILHHYTLSEIIGFYEQKYPKQQLLISIPNAITYFEEAEEGPDPISLKQQTWENVKTFLQLKTREYLS